MEKSFQGERIALGDLKRQLERIELRRRFPNSQDPEYNFDADLRAAELERFAGYNHLAAFAARKGKAVSAEIVKELIHHLANDVLNHFPQELKPGKGLFLHTDDAFVDQAERTLLRDVFTDAGEVRTLRDCRALAECHAAFAEGMAEAATAPALAIEEVRRLYPEGLRAGLAEELRKLHPEAFEEPQPPAATPAVQKKATRGTKGKNVEARMVSILTKDPLAGSWTAQQFADACDCARSCIVATKTWKKLQEVRAIHAAQKKGEMKVDKRRTAKRRRG